MCYRRPNTEPNLVKHLLVAGANTQHILPQCLRINLNRTVIAIEALPNIVINVFAFDTGEPTFRFMVHSSLYTSEFPQFSSA